MFLSVATADAACFRRHPGPLTPPKGTHRWVCQAAPYIPVTGQQAEWDWREEAAQAGQWRLPGGWGWEARSTRGWASPTDPVQGENASYSKQEEAGGWDVSHLASKSRWGWS